MSNSKTVIVNECYLSIQGEGVRTGTANVFVRFSHCNLKCDIAPGPKSPGGFACDTEFASGRRMTWDELVAYIETVAPDWRSTGRWLILTGGEPGLQLSAALIDFLHAAGYLLAIESNGSVELPPGLDWITISPKVAEHAIKQLSANEVKYVRGYGQAIPSPVIKADNQIISPAFNGTNLDSATLRWCEQLVLENPRWRLGVQLHKLLTQR